MRKLLSCAMLVLLIISVYSESAITEPVLASSIEATITKTGTVRALGGTLKYVEINISAPQKTGWQLPSYSLETVKDSEGNTFSVVKNSNPQTPFEYSISTEVLTKARVTDSLPESYSVPEELKRYALPSSGIESDSKAIANLAKEITSSIVLKGCFVRVDATI